MPLLNDVKTDSHEDHKIFLLIVSWEMKLNHPSNTTGSFTLPLLYINIQSFKRRQLFCLSKVIKWKKQTKKQKVNPKSMLFYFTGFWAFCELISCFFPRKKSNIPGRDMHDWSWKVCLFQGKKKIKGILKRGIKRKVLVCREGSYWSIFNA